MGDYGQCFLLQFRQWLCHSIRASLRSNLPVPALAPPPSACIETGGAVVDGVDAQSPRSSLVSALD